jgi:hypothetical protein
MLVPRTPHQPDRPTWDMNDFRADGHRAGGRDDAIYDRVLGWLVASPPASAERATRRAA